MITKGIKSEAKISVNYAQPSFYQAYSDFTIGEEYDYLYYKKIDFSLMQNIIFNCYVNGNFGNTGKLIFYHDSDTIHEETGISQGSAVHLKLDVTGYNDEAIFEINAGSGTATKVIQIGDWGWYGIDIDLT